MAFSTRLSRAASSRADGGCAANGSDTPSGPCRPPTGARPGQARHPRRTALPGTGRGRPTDSSGGTLNHETAHWHSPVDGRGGRQCPMHGHRRRRGEAFPSESRGKRARAPSGDVALADFCARLRQAGKVESIGVGDGGLAVRTRRDRLAYVRCIATRSTRGCEPQVPCVYPLSAGWAGSWRLRFPRRASALSNTSASIGLTVSRRRSLSAATRRL